MEDTFYYGEVDKTSHSYGFLEKGDPRVTADMIELTFEQWQALLNGQSEGQEIVYYNGRVFCAVPGKYYQDENGVWCEKSDAEIEQEKIAQRRKNFEDTFIQTSWGWYRKVPKGYSNALQSVDAIKAMVSGKGGFVSQIAQVVIFYTQPDYTDPTQCTEEWLIAHQYHHQACTTEEFTEFYLDFQSRWAMDQFQNT
jgi:hypothetical protein